MSRNIWRKSVIAAAVAFSSVSIAAEAADQKVVKLNIASQPLGQSINEFARQTGVQVAVFDDVAVDITTPSVNGAYEPKEALQVLLANTGLSIEDVDDGTYAIRASRNGEIQLAEKSDETPQTNVGQSASQAQSRRIDEIVVTAQRREENQQDVPIVITSITSDQMSKLGVLRSDDLGAAVPGLLMNRQNGASQPYLRGVGATSSTGGLESPVAVYIDGVYIPSQTGAVFSFNNIQQIEVLKGPQGTLFGRNSAGGLINIMTETPHQEFEGRASVSYGNYNTGEAKLFLNGGLTDSMAGNIALRYTEQGEGPGRNLAAPSVEGPKGKSYGGRAKLAIELSENTDLLLAADYNYDANSLGIWRQLVPGANGMDGVTVYSGNFYNVNNNISPYSVNEMAGASATIEHDFGNVVLKSITAYRWDKNFQPYDQEATPVSIATALQRFSTTSFTQELQLLSNNDSPFSWITGLFYFDSNATMKDTEVTGAAAAAVGGVLGFEGDGQDTKSYAGYVQGTLAFTDHTNATIGLRYTSDEKSISAGRYGGMGQSLGFREASETYNELTYRAAIDHHFSDSVMVFASYDRGFKSGAFNISQPFDNPVEPETLDAIQIGVKTDLWDQRLRLNLSGFYYWYENIQLTTLLEGSPTPTLFNAAESTVKGIETELTFIPTDHLTLTLSLSYLDGTYDSFPDAPLSTPAARGNTVTRADASGNRMIRSPEFSGMVSVSYDVPTSYGSFSLTVSDSYKGEFYWEADNRLEEGATHLVSADVTVRFGEQEKFYTRAYGRNLLSEKYSIYTVESSVGDIYAPGMPRTYGVEFGVSF